MIAAAITRLTGDLDGLHRRYAIEQRDVDRLENLSLTRLLADLRGSREQALDRERVEAEAARYRVAEAQDRLDTLDQAQPAGRRRCPGRRGQATG